MLSEEALISELNCSVTTMSKGMKSKDRDESRSLLGKVSPLCLSLCQKEEIKISLELKHKRA